VKLPHYKTLEMQRALNRQNCQEKLVIECLHSATGVRHAERIPLRSVDWPLPLGILEAVF